MTAQAIGWRFRSVQRPTSKRRRYIFSLATAVLLVILSGAALLFPLSSLPSLEKVEIEVSTTTASSPISSAYHSLQNIRYSEPIHTNISANSTRKTLTALYVGSPVEHKKWTPVSVLSIPNGSESSMKKDNGTVNESVSKKEMREIRRSRPRAVRVLEMWPDEALLYAKKEIQNAPPVVDYPDLYAPLFRNASMFKRSYELMVKILKVYIYQDGEKPIFHTPELQGIYASEGWFMKLMEENRGFVVNDSNKAHLFYMPYSAHQLRLALYVPESHNMKPISIFLKNYVNSLAAKYPFWNRTKGKDHFLVACHDWGSYTLTEHEELCKNTIKALCNADTSEGIFVRGKDVSLPETTIRTPRRPLRFIGGGRRVSQRSILAFFAGNMHGRVRPILLRHWGHGKDEDMKIYGPLPKQISQEMTYVQHMKTSKFCICPMGYEVNSPRIIEAIYYECVPVIIADNFALPFEEVLDWSAFSVVVEEKDIPNLKNILLAIPLRKYLVMQTNVKMVQKHFLWHPKPLKYDLYHMIMHSIWLSRLNQVQV